MPTYHGWNTYKCEDRKTQPHFEPNDRREYLVFTANYDIKHAVAIFRPDKEPCFEKWISNCAESIGDKVIAWYEIPLHSENSQT